MQDLNQFFMELLPSVAQAWIAAGIFAAGALVTGLLLLAAVIRGEDAAINLDTRPPGPIARRVRGMLNLRVYDSHSRRS